MRGGRIGAVLVLLVLGVAAQSVSGAAAAPVAPGTTLQLFDNHVQHIVFVMQENHAYDSLYGEYCLVAGTYCSDVGNGIPAGTCLPRNLTNPAKGCVAPYNFTAKDLSPPQDLPHNWNSTHTAYDHGAMNGFLPAEYGSNETMGHYNGTTAPVYWDLAEEYGLGDDFFSSVQSYSDPNHWYMLSSTAPNISYQTILDSNLSTWHDRSTYLNESNGTRTIAAELLNSSVSWNWFDYALPSYAKAVQPVPLASAYDYWDPLAARAASYIPSTAAHFQPRSQFFADAANGTLPNISWVIPAGQDSDHPPFNLTMGQDWIASIVDALELSPEWNSTVLFVSWDEYGGFYDHVAPPVIDSYGDGFRVPLLVISPYVKQGIIVDKQLDFDSILHLMEKRFGLKCLGPRDCHAALPLAFFNFNRKPRAPIEIFPYGQATYPMPLESSGKLPYYGLADGAAPIVYEDPPPADEPASFDWS